MNQSVNSKLVRLKLYIDSVKFEKWKNYLEDSEPDSLFFLNFSEWIRLTLIQSPLEIRSQKVFQIFTDLETNSVNRENNNKITKSVWIPSNLKRALMKRKGHLSLNAFVILLLDDQIFKINHLHEMAFQIRNLEERLQNLNLVMNNLIDKQKTQL